MQVWILSFRVICFLAWLKYQLVVFITARLTHAICFVNDKRHLGRLLLVPEVLRREC